MDEREFVERRQSSWHRLTDILKAASRGGLKTLSRDELRELGPLYRRAASDLAYARAHATSGSLKSFLNMLVARSYALLYQTDTRSWSGIKTFFTRDFPQTFRRRLPFFLASVACLAVGFGVGYFLVGHSADYMDIWAPAGSAQRQNLDVWASGNVTGRTADPKNAVYASFLMVHNIQVSFLAYALGILFDVLSAWVMFANGAELGAYTAYMQHVHQIRNWWPNIVPHGVVELSETCIAGAAGLSLGWALLVPGRLRRRDALVVAALDSVKLILGGMALLVFAGLTEGFVSHSLLPVWLKWSIGVVSGIALYAYLLMAAREPRDTTSPAAAEPGANQGWEAVREASSPSPRGTD